MDKKQEAGPENYDQVYIRKAHDPTWRANQERRMRPAARYVEGDSVLDLGCGHGAFADMIGNRRYLGVDFSPVIIEYAREHVQNPNARFILGGFYDDLTLEICDTVVLLQVLEHTWKYKELFDFACKLANRRVIVTVPKNAPGGTHLKHQWSKEDLGELGPMGIFEQLDSIRWLAVYDMRELGVSVS